MLGDDFDVSEDEEEPSDPYAEEGVDDPFIVWPRDPRIDPAKADLVEWFEANPLGVFYGRQIEVLFEKKYFHWITHKALKELTSAGAILTELRTTPGNNKLRLYWSKRNRYPKRVASAIVSQVDLHSAPNMTRAIGHQAESLFGVAAAREGFKLYGPGVRAYGGKVWNQTEHDLDWIFERDGLGWGVEIKNTWAYIDRAEMLTKITLCKFLGLQPLFIMRWAPKSYIEVIRKAGGFGLLYEHQFFPLGHESSMERLRELGLPVSNPVAVPDGIFRRFVTKGHEARVKL